MILERSDSENKLLYSIIPLRYLRQKEKINLNTPDRSLRQLTLPAQVQIMDLLISSVWAKEQMDCTLKDFRPASGHL